MPPSPPRGELLRCARRRRCSACLVVPRPLHTSALGVPGERKGADAEHGERGAGEGAVPGTAINSSRAGKAGDPHERRGPQQLGESLPPGVAPTLTLRQHSDTKLKIQLPAPISRQ